MTDRPIDPGDVLAVCNLMDVFQQAEGEERVYHWGNKYSIRGGAVMAVARSVLPEGYVAVPVDMARAVLQDLDRVRAELNRRNILVISTTAVNDLRNLLPDDV